MKIWKDKIEFSDELDIDMNDLSVLLSGRIEKSQFLQFRKKQGNDVFYVESINLNWLMFPPQHKYWMKIQLEKVENGRCLVNVRVKGNMLYVFFKYLGVILLFWLGMHVFFNPFNIRLAHVSFNYFNLLGIFFCVTLISFFNYVNMKEGSDKIKEILSQE